MKFADGIQQYVIRKHAQGVEFHKGESCLTGLCRHIGDVELSCVKSQDVLIFLNASRAAAATWRLRYFVLQRFFDFWAARGAMPEMLMPPIRPKERQNFSPHVYSRAELRVLLRATVKNQQSNISIARPSMRAFMILLYGTGARIGEVLNLSVGDINLERRSISILKYKLQSMSGNSHRDRSEQRSPKVSNVEGEGEVSKSAAFCYEGGETHISGDGKQELPSASPTHQRDP